MKSIRIGLVVLLAVTLAATVSAGGRQEARGEASSQLEIVMVAKHEGISWFDDMRDGVEAFGREHADVTAYQIAPEGGDPARQVQMVEDLIAKGVDAILIVPNDPVSMIPVIERAKAAGIVVVSHEAESLAGVVDWNMEAFRNEEFGRVMLESLAREMGGSGDFVGMVGALTMQTHMQWYEAGMAHIRANYPNMRFILNEPVEDFNTEQTAYNRAMELLRTYPNIRGMFGNSASSTIMMAQAVEERGLQDQVAVVGLTLPSMSSEYLKSGALRQGQAWRPADAGYVTAMIAYRALKGQPIQDGVNLGRAGYESISVSNGTVYGNAPLIFTAQNVDQFPF